MTQKKSNQATTQGLLNKANKIAGIFGTVRDVAILLAALVTIVFNYLSAPVREDLRTTKTDVQAIKDDFNAHKDANISAFTELNNSFNGLKDSIVGTNRNSINSRLSRIEGKLDN